MRLRCSPPTPCGLKGRRAPVAIDLRLALKIAVAMPDRHAVNLDVIDPPPVLKIVVQVATVVAMLARHAVNPVVNDPRPVRKIVVPVETLVAMPARHTVAPGRDRSWSSN